MRNFRLSKRVNRDETSVIPMIGPSSFQEALADLDEAEREFEAGEGLSMGSVVQEIRERYKVYAY